jgi:hypothetical protein
MKCCFPDNPHIPDDDRWHSNLDAWKTCSEPMDSQPSREQEDERERRWAGFIGECREFAGSEPDGFAAVLRAVAEAMKSQGALFRG